MKEIVLSEKESVKYVGNVVTQLITEIKQEPVDVKNAKYLHGSGYENSAMILKHGILPLKEVNRLGIMNLSKNRLQLFSDINTHVNGIDNVSLAVLGLDDLYVGEDEYDPRDIIGNVVFLVSDEIQSNVYRSSQRYGNEFLHRGKIDASYIKSVDIRLLDYISTPGCLCNTTEMYSKPAIDKILKRYHCLKDIALAIKELELNIPIREQSYDDNFSIDIEKATELPKIIMK